MLIVAPSASVSKRTSGRFWRSSHSRSLPVPFTFVARAENLIRGRPDLDDTIKRLQAFDKAGADVLFAPGLRDIGVISTVCREVTKPVNVLMGFTGATFSTAELAAAGVKRISVGGALARLAYGTIVKAAREMKEKGTFGFAAEAIGFAELEGYFAPQR